MSLITDLFFYNALKADDDIMEETEGRIFNTARNEEDENEDKLPYIIITYDGMQNDQGTKDSTGESDIDRDTISVLCVAEDREDLADLMEMVRPCIKDAMEDQDATEQGFIIDDYSLTASAIECDPSRPCHFQTLTYQCETNNA